MGAEGRAGRAGAEKGGRMIDITDEMSSRANESGFVFLSFPLLFVFRYCRRALSVRKDPTDARFQYPVDAEHCVRKACLCSVSAWRMGRMETRKIRHQDVMTRWRKLRAA